ncbi:hypothetical protein Mapa_009268 [Marchantia paleacea]|nr:hypothetical protein Mapa_009268 [Marchantia paleacea]
MCSSDKSKPGSMKIKTKDTCASACGNRDKDERAIAPHPVTGLSWLASQKKHHSVQLGTLTGSGPKAPLPFSLNPFSSHAPPDPSLGEIFSPLDDVPGFPSRLLVWEISPASQNRRGRRVEGKGRRLYQLYRWCTLRPKQKPQVHDWCKARTVKWAAGQRPGLPSRRERSRSSIREGAAAARWEQERTGGSEDADEK